MGELISFSVFIRFGVIFLIQSCFSEWLGALAMGTSLLVSPIVIAFCRTRSTRVTAVMGGLVTALGCLFTSFATQFHQLIFRWVFCHFFNHCISDTLFERVFQANNPQSATIYHILSLPDHLSGKQNKKSWKSTASRASQLI